MTECKAYPDYSHSGIKWIGDIPSHWECVSLKNLDPYNSELAQTGPFGAQLHADDYVDEGVPLILIKNVKNLAFDTSGIPKITPEDADRLSAYKVCSGDIVFSRVGSIGRIALVTDNESGWVISGQMLRLRINCSRLNEKYSIYALSSRIVEDEISYRSVGSTRESINTEILRNIKIPFPSLDEQCAIANFLDHETAKIDTLIEKQQQLIKLLKEKRLAMVDVAIRDSEQVRLENCSKIVAREVEYSDDEFYTPIGLFNRGRGLFHKDLTLGIDLGDSDFYYIEDNDLIFSGQFAWEGAVALADGKDHGCIASHRYPIVKGNDGVLDTTYLWAFFTSQRGDFLLNECSRGAAGRNRPLNMNYLMKEEIPVPPIAAQLAVTRLVFYERQITEKIKKVIGALEEKRISLISAVVIGKIDVRGWVAPAHPCARAT